MGNGLPPMPGSGIVPPAPAQYTFAQPTPATAPAPEAAPHKYGILGRLLGDKHRDEVASKEALVKFYMDGIHSAYNDPSNRTPDEVLVDYGNQLGKLIGHPEAAKAIKSDVQRHIDAKAAKEKLSQVNATQNQAQQGMGVPATPAAAPASPPAQPPGLPAPPVPFVNGEQAGGPAPLAQIPPPVRAASVAGTSGFGIPPNGLAASRITRAQLGQEQAQQEQPSLEMRAKVAREQSAQDYAALAERYKNEPWFKGLSDRQKAEVLSKVNISPELRPTNLPGLVAGKDIPAGEKDAFGQEVTSDGFYKLRMFADGTKEYVPQVGVTSGVIEPDSKSPTGFSRVVRDRLGAEVSRSSGATPPAAYVPTTTTNTHQGEQVVTVGNEVRTVPVTSTTSTKTTRAVPGMPAPPVQPGASPAAPAPAAAPPARPGKTLGTSPQAWKMQVENQYTPNGAKLMTELEPRMDMMERVKKALEPYKNSATPATSLLDSIAYTLGFGTDRGALLSQLNLGSIAQAGTLIRGVSRSQEVLGKAMVHTPDAWKDSGKLMYEKLTQIIQNMNDMKSAVDKYEKKYPGMAAPPASLPAPPGDRKPLGSFERK